MTDAPTNGDSAGADGAKASPTLRIRLPIDYHLRLHRLKLVTGRNMAQVIRHALDAYLVAEETRLALPQRVDPEPDGSAAS